MAICAKRRGYPKPAHLAASRMDGDRRVAGPRPILRSFPRCSPALRRRLSSRGFRVRDSTRHQQNRQHIEQRSHGQGEDDEHLHGVEPQGRGRVVATIGRTGDQDRPPRAERRGTQIRGDAEDFATQASAASASPAANQKTARTVRAKV